VALARPRQLEVGDQPPSPSVDTVRAGYVVAASALSETIAASRMTGATETTNARMLDAGPR